MRYIAQRHMTHTCGPVAILNVLEWAGLKVTHKKDIQMIQDICGYRRGHGITAKQVAGGLKCFGNDVKFRIRNKVRIDEIDRHLNKGGVVLMHTSRKLDGKYSGHYWVITEKTPRYYISHNLRWKESTARITRKTVVARFRKCCAKKQPRAFLINKQGT